MSEAVIFTGIQAVGKTTFYRKHFSATHTHINLDTLKTRRRETTLLEDCLRERRSFVVDNTNALAAERARYIRPAREAGYTVTGYYFPSSLPDALRRNQKRTGKEYIPEIGILAKFQALQIPCLNEGFDRIYTVTIAQDGKFLIKIGLP